MNEEIVQQMMAAAERLASATEALDRVLGKLDAQQEMLNAKVDRIVAAVEETTAQTAEQRQVAAAGADLRERLSGLEKSNAELKAQAARMARKTLSPVVSALLAKNEIEGERFDGAMLDRTLAALSVEQRMAVKAEMARAGMIE
jgi:predicted RNase H-like nuclease (RuvC/YqgF family)